MRKFDGMKRLLVFLLAFSMVLSCVPVPILAAEGDACAVTPECTGVYVEGVCSVCGEEEPALNHTHVYDGEAVYTQKDETVHTVTRACTTCEEKPTETVDEPHTYVEGVCACGREETHAHFGGQATCKAQAVCEGCGESYGQLAGHSYEDLKCTVCGADCTHSYVDGICETCGFSCVHESYSEGKCTVCNTDCPHVAYQDGKCKACGMDESTREPVVLTISAWSWVDDYEILSDDGTYATLPNAADWETLKSVLPAAITAMVDGAEVEIPVQWKCENFPAEGEGQGTYELKAILPEGYVLGEAVSALELEVDMGAAEQYHNLKGSGSVSSPYEIYTSTDLHEFVWRVNEQNSAACAKLMNDIAYDYDGDNDGSIDCWYTIGSNDKPYAGTFDGNGHTLSGLWLDDTNGFNSFIRVLGEGGKVTNLNLSASFSGASNSGGIAGRSFGTISNCAFSGTINCASGSNIGGIVGDNKGTVTGCRNNGTVSGATNVGGIAGSNSSTVVLSSNSGAVSGNQYVGGIAGLNGVWNESSSALICNCYNTGSIIGTKYAGGINGMNMVNVEYCYNAASVDCTAAAGGVIGENRGAAKRCYSDSTVCDKNTNGTDTATATKVNSGKFATDEFLSGRICYYLNDETSTGTLIWYQTLGTDTYPRFTGKIVYSSTEKPNYFNGYTVTVSGDGNGTATASRTIAAAGAEVTLTATPNSGYKFKEWKVIPGSVTVADNKFTMPAVNVEIQAVFETVAPVTPPEPTAYNINIDSGITGGTVVADKAKAAAGETVILTVTPANGYALDTLKVNNEAVTVANNKYTLTMPAGDVTVTAIFKSVFTPVAEVTAAGTTTQYASLETALEEAAEFSDGATVKLLQNIPNQNEAIVVTGGKITLNLNDKTITDTMTSAEQCYVLQFTGGTHTIQGGTIVGAVQTYGESKVTFASGTITSGQKFTVMAEGNSTLQVSGGTISNTRTQNGSGVALAAASNSKVVTKGSINAIYMALHAAGASEVSVSGGSLTGGTAGIYVDGDSQVAISDGSVSSPQGRAIWTFGGATSVTGGTFSSSLDVRKKDGTVTLSGGTFMGGIKVESAMLKDILADGCNYYLNDQIVNITADQTEITGGDVVVKRSVTGVSLDKTSLNLVVGQKEKLNATVSPDLATNKKLIWISGDETVATVDEAGEVTAKGAGETTITVTTEDGNFTASCKVEVVAEYPVWVAGTRVTSENMDNVLGDGTVSYDPIAKKLTLSGNIRCDKESTTAIATTYGAGVTLTIAGSGTISASSGSGIYTNKANVKLTGGPFTINGTSYGIYLGEGDLFVDGAKVKATTNDTTKNGVLTYTGVEIMENDGGLLAVTGTKAVVRGSYTMDVETFEELWVAQGAALTISSGETVEVKDKINSSGTIKINGTLKVPAGSGRKTMSGGILYIGTKGYKWDEMAKVYRCLEHDWTYRLKTGTTDTVEAYCEECQSTSSDVLTISKPTREVYNDQGNGNASLNDYSASVFTNVGEIRYQEKGGGTAIERPLTDAGTYIASVTVGSGENTVTASVEYTIAPRPVTLRVTLKTNSKVYDGTTTAEVDTVTPEGVIRADKEVVVQYGAANYNSPNVADATEVRFTGWGLTGNRSENYVLSAQPASVSATITAKSLKDVQATLSDNVIFNGQPVPELTVKDGDTTLEKDKDYTVSQTGSNGEFTMTITGMGNYQDVATDKPTYLVVTLPDPDKVEPDDKSAIDAYDRYVEWNQKYQDAELKKALEELLKALTDYDVIKGHKSSYTRGSSKKVSFTANGYFGKFVELKVDGKTLDPKCYTAKSGSTIVTFKNSYLNSLSDGKHDVRFVYVDGSTDGDDYFRIATNNGSPFTGDDNHHLMMTGIMMTSLMCIVIMVMCVPRKKGKYQR